MVSLNLRLHYPKITSSFIHYTQFYCLSIVAAGDTMKMHKILNSTRAAFSIGSWIRWWTIANFEFESRQGYPNITCSLHKTKISLMLSIWRLKSGCLIISVMFYPTRLEMNNGETTFYLKNGTNRDCFTRDIWLMDLCERQEGRPTCNNHHHRYIALNRHNVSIKSNKEESSFNWQL